MAAQATWISDLAEVENSASFENDDATSTVALDSDELGGRGLPSIIGKSAALQRVLDMVRVVAPTDATVLMALVQTQAEGEVG
jgi:transcriptional regulator with GAF, ATPase, and Fis domain